jgi:hypothetical protein
MRRGFKLLVSGYRHRFGGELLADESNKLAFVSLGNR